MIGAFTAYARGALALALIGAAACARIEPPPGGPPDTAPPRLESSSPAPMASLPGFDGEAEFRFNEVISEGGTASQGTGMGDLERLVVLSPTTRVPEVRWRRNRITVRPREGWQPNTVYRVELLPGVTDLRNNRSTEGTTVITFTTGGALPTDTLRGRAWDWTIGRPAAGALIEAALLPDTLIYRFVADSSGGFVLAPLPAGTYLITAALDPERDRRRTGREPFDSASVATGTADSVELWMFPHDSTAPRLAELTRTDSLSIRLRFSQLLDPAQPLDRVRVSVQLLPDSTAVAAGPLLGLVGTVIGTGVFLKAAVMAQEVGTPSLVLLAWVAAGLLSLAGALDVAAGVEVWAETAVARISAPVAP